MHLHIGVHSDRGSLKKFIFDLLEMPVSASMPKAKTLREMRAGRPNLKFALRLHPDVALKGVAHEDVERAISSAAALEADVIVIATGPRFTPTQRNQTQLGALADALRAEGRHIAWEPRGVWAPDEADAIAQAHNLLLVRDLSRENAPTGDVIYTRLLPFGFGARVSQNAMEHLAGQLAEAETAFVVVQPDGAKRTSSTLREWLELEDE